MSITERREVAQSSKTALYRNLKDERQRLRHTYICFNHYTLGRVSIRKELVTSKLVITNSLKKITRSLYLMSYLTIEISLLLYHIEYIEWNVSGNWKIHRGQSHDWINKNLQQWGRGLHYHECVCRVDIQRSWLHHIIRS